MQVDMPIDVILACYNGEPWLADTMDSILAQTHRPASVVVVDDGSTDNSVDLMAARFPAISVEHTSRGGSSAARNHGLRMTHSPYVIFMDQDDLWHPRHLEILSELARKHPHAPLVASSGPEFLDGDRPDFKARNTETEMFDPWATYPAHGFNCIPAVSFFQRRLLEDAGGCPERHDPMADYSIWMRLSMTDPIPVSKARSAAHRTHRRSHSARLRSDRLGYSEHCLRVDGELLDILSSCAHVTAARKRQAATRFRVALAFHELAKSPLTASDQLHSAMAEIDDALRWELPSYRRAFLRHFVTWMPYDRISPARIHAALLDCWPNTATKRDLESVIVDRLPVFPELLRFSGLGRSFSFHRTRLTLRTLTRRTLARVRRSIRPGGLGTR